MAAGSMELSQHPMHMNTLNIGTYKMYKQYKMNKKCTMHKLCKCNVVHKLCKEASVKLKRGWYSRKIAYQKAFLQCRFGLQSAVLHFNLRSTVLQLLQLNHLSSP